MSNKETGGSAFPHAKINTEWHSIPASEGLTIRDWFAGMAMQGILSCVNKPYPMTAEDEEKTGSELVSDYAYFMADAMMRERSK